MPIPKHEDIRLPALKLLTEHESLKMKEFELPLAEMMGLTEDETTQEYDSGNGRIFYDRISWALSFMSMSGLVSKPSRGVYQLSELGKEFIIKPNEINAFIAQKVQERRAENKPTSSSDSIVSTDLTPQEELEESALQIKEAVKQDILDVLLSKSPREFEKLVVTLLQKMGYGGSIKDSGIVTQYSNDKGIDGIIKEDVLGLGKIHIQAKRYARDNTISRDEVQKFVGALAVAQSDKGVFITTSSYSRHAIEYAESLNGSTTVVLIDGEQLTDYIYEFDVGMQPKQTIEIKKLDSEFWDKLLDDPKVGEE